jgi:amino acid adenylation domain-containing protein
MACLWLEAESGETDTPPAAAAGPDNLAYLLFTSGSTGGPKGVAVEHRHLATYVRSLRARLDLPAGGGYATVSTIAADLGHTAVFPALVSGGCLHVIARHRLTDPEAFADYSERHAIDVLKIVPSHLEALLSGSRPASVLPKARLVMGGEASSWKLVRRIAELAPGCAVFNHYGPTETTVGVLTHPAGLSESGAIVPLGRPLGGVAVHLLDGEGQPVPVGVAGEIAVGGATVTRGYLGRPELTAERFVPDPWGTPGARLYRTGDLARRLPDGALEFLGRADDQVKVRGYRVEPGEVASALARCPEVREAYVGAVPAGPDSDVCGDRRLVAWAVPAPGRTPSRDSLHAFLAERLPAWMVPSAFVLLDILPLTANGKVDRRALPLPAEPQVETAAPRNASEEAVAAVWREVLGVEHPGIHDVFFDLGGHSLNATRVVSRLRAALGVDLPLSALFETPTIAGLATTIAGIQTAANDTAHPPKAPALGRIARSSLRSAAATAGAVQGRRAV